MIRAVFQAFPGDNIEFDSRFSILRTTKYSNDSIPELPIESVQQAHTPMGGPP